MWVGLGLGCQYGTASSDGVARKSGRWDVGRGVGGSRATSMPTGTTESGCVLSLVLFVLHKAVVIVGE